MTPRVRPVDRSDASGWLAMRLALWPGGSRAEHAEDIDEFFAGRAREPLAVLIAEDEAGRSIGFAELSIRPQAEGCRTDRVAYLEGWFVAPEARRRGIGTALIRAAEAWARARGCKELASDTASDDAAGAGAHEGVGFVHAATVRCYRKDL